MDKKKITHQHNKPPPVLIHKKLQYIYIYTVISLKHDDVKNQNKPAVLCIVGFIGGLLSNNTMIIQPF